MTTIKDVHKDATLDSEMRDKGIGIYFATGSYVRDLVSSGPGWIQPPAPETFATGNTAAHLALISIVNFNTGSYLRSLFF